MGGVVLCCVLYLSVMLFSYPTAENGVGRHLHQWLRHARLPNGGFSKIADARLGATFYKKEKRKIG